MKLRKLINYCGMISYFILFTLPIYLLRHTNLTTSMEFILCIHLVITPIILRHFLISNFFYLVKSNTAEACVYADTEFLDFIPAIGPIFFFNLLAFFIIKESNLVFFLVFSIISFNYCYRFISFFICAETNLYIMKLNSIKIIKIIDIKRVSPSYSMTNFTRGGRNYKYTSGVYIELHNEKPIHLIGFFNSKSVKSIFENINKYQSVTSND